jgi:curli production assembly/transport component CsgG
LKHVIAILLAATLAGCSWIPREVPKSIQSPPEVQVNPQESTLRGLPPLDGPTMTIGVYSFTDKTGQRKPADNMASLSSAVTQGAEVWVIDALLEAGGGVGRLRMISRHCFRMGWISSMARGGESLPTREKARCCG